jgi:hypothetical protein
MADQKDGRPGAANPPPESSGPRIVIAVRTDGVETSASIPPIVVPIPRALSLRVASMHALEQGTKALKPALPDALKGAGFK